MERGLASDGAGEAALERTGGPGGGASDRVVQSDGGGRPHSAPLESGPGWHPDSAFPACASEPPRRIRSLRNPSKMGGAGAQRLRPAHPTLRSLGSPTTPLAEPLAKETQAVLSTLSRSPGPAGVLPPREGGRAAAPGLADSAQHRGSGAGGGAEPPSPGHGPPVPPPACQSLRRAAAERGELRRIEELQEPCIFLV